MVPVSRKVALRDSINTSGHALSNRSQTFEGDNNNASVDQEFVKGTRPIPQGNILPVWTLGRKGYRSELRLQRLSNCQCWTMTCTCLVRAVKRCGKMVELWLLWAEGVRLSATPCSGPPFKERCAAPPAPAPSMPQVLATAGAAKGYNMGISLFCKNTGSKERKTR